MRETANRSDTAGVSVADRENQAAAEKATKAQLAAQTEIDDLCWLMSDKRGRRFVWRLLERSGIYRTSFDGDALRMAFLEGQRNLGLTTMGQITQHCPDRLIEMQKEARAHERRNDRSTSAR
jgi:hypothetical protein